MDNKLFGRTFIVILTSALLFFGAANAGALAVDKWVFPSQKFGENTYIGTTDVSGMALADAKMLFAGQTKAWRSTAELHVTYQDATAEYPLDTAEILLDETISQAQTGAQNPFVYHLPSETTSAFLAQQFPVAAFTEADIAAVKAKLEQSLAAGQTITNVMIGDDTLQLEKQIVSEVSFPHNLTNAGIDEVLTALQGLEIPAGAQFSFLEFISELNLNEVTDAELTEIASAIYTAVLKTNFSVEERSIGNAVPELIPVGQEAAINRTLGIDLVFTNPNASSFQLDVAIEGQSLAVSLSGYPLVYTYAIQTGSEEKVKPRLIKQFSAFVSYDKEVEEDGAEGVRIEVLRSILADGKELEVQAISTDFYPPVHRVEVYPLKAAASESAPTLTPKPGEAGFVDANGDGIHDTPAASTTVPLPGQPGYVDANGDGIHDVPTTATPVPQPGQPGFVDTNGDGNHDNPAAGATVPLPGQPGYVDANGDGVHDVEVPNTQPAAPATDTPAKDKTTKDETDEPVYDKGGNLVNP
ncbi:VanW family protein [Planococcus shixiaomingii]|uniref:VanW family protein n=1 Tax=Planococcus shixiaomingii TaxID=3058393 RepID=UPI002638B45D|nr:VanW family protein [Planococcus sp. N022]WKA56245.1 VanW family protein [Planococcus sp. N022]